VVNKSVIEMKSTIRIALAIIVTFCISCSTMKHNIQKNNTQTDKIIKSLLDKNGNVFYLNSTYVISSTVWTYTDDNIEIYRLTKGNVVEQSTFPDKGLSNYKVPTFKELDIETKECGYELDGDGFGFRIKRSSELEQQDLPISIECFTKQKYKSEFLNKIVKDINTYKLWNVQYE